MDFRKLVGMFLVAVLLAVGANEVRAQDCEICHNNKCWDISPEAEVGCIAWEDDPWLGTGCDDFDMWCGVTFHIDLMGAPAQASMVAMFAGGGEEGTWIRRGCDDAVLRFNFSADHVVWLTRQTELIAL